VVFRRLDVGGKLIRAHNAFVNEVILSTSIENQGVKISTVEHLMSAFSAQTSHNNSIRDEFIARLIEIRSFPRHQRLSDSCLHNGL
jgi:UDP-3-O-acyl-N-acetylglucosamine deacetylase